MLKAPKRLEHNIEETFVRQAKKLGWWVCPKIMGNGRKGDPDRLMIRNGKAIFVEFKRNTKLKLSPAQMMFKNNFSDIAPLYVVRSLEEGKALLDKLNYLQNSITL